MIHTGTTTKTLFRTEFCNGEPVDVAFEVSIDWEAELTELGDGKKEWDFQCTATKEDGSEIELTTEEEESLFDSLRADGEF